LVRFPVLAFLRYWSSSSGCHTLLAPIFKPPGNWPAFTNRRKVRLEMPVAWQTSSGPINTGRLGLPSKLSSFCYFWPTVATSDIVNLSLFHSLIKLSAT
jgi:hypothetical protein